MHILSGHSLQFIVICYNQNISFIEQGAWKKVELLFNGGIQGAPLCACCFCAGISMSCIEAP